MNSKRNKHINETFKREISNVIQRMKDERIHESIVTVNNLSVSPDLSFCRVYISTLQGSNHSKRICKILNYASGYIQSSVSNRIKSRCIPKLLFVPCDSTEYAFKIDSLISDINKKDSKKNFDKIIDFLSLNDNFAIYTHENPDGDAIGSSTALCLSLRKTGKHACVFYANDINEKFNFMNEMISPSDFIPEHNICLDCSEKKRLGVFQDKDFDVCIDHHDINVCDIANLFYIYKNSSSTAEIIYDIIDALKVSIDENISTCIYTGILCDTGRFKWSNVNKRTFEISSFLIDKVDKNINSKIFDNVPRKIIEFQSEIIKKFEYIGPYCLVFVPIYMRLQFGIEYSDLEFLSSFPLQIKGIEVSIIAKEVSENKFKISVRSFNGEAINLCKKFGGGGHDNASGFEIEGDIDTIKNKIINEISI